MTVGLSTVIVPTFSRTGFGSESLTLMPSRPLPRHGSSSKHYSAQLKADAVALYQSRPGATIKQVAADPGVNPETLRN